MTRWWSAGKVEFRYIWAARFLVEPWLCLATIFGLGIYLKSSFWVNDAGEAKQLHAGLIE